MTITTPGGSPWPARLAYSAALIFTLASASTNLIFGIGKGTDTASSVVWAAVSVAVSVVFALSWPGLISAIEQKKWALVPMAVAALILTGSYSVTAALGSASGGRTLAAIEEKDITDKRTKAQASYDAAKAELENLKSSRPLAELEALVAAARPVCRIIVQQGRRDTTCAKPAALTAELGRAQRRAELEATLDEAKAELSGMYTPKVANSDAVALAGYLAAIGVKTDTDTLNRLLVLLAVLVIECGGGMAFALGMALADKPMSNQTAHTTPGHSAENSIAEKLATPKELGGVHTVHSPAQSSRDRLLAMVRDANGALRTGHRALGEALGVSATRAGQLLRDLAADGAIRVRAGKTGSVVTLAHRLVS